MFPRPTFTRAPGIPAAMVVLHFAMGPLHGQLNENCVVAILNRTSQVRADGTWDLPNIPANFGPVRARATCVEAGITRSGQSALFTILQNRMNAIPPIILGPVTAIPSSLDLTANPVTLTQAGQTTQITVTGTYANGPAQNLTSHPGTQYRSSNTAIASISGTGLVTARASGNVIIQATHEGTQGLLQIGVVLSRDSDGDGILDDIEIANGLNPNNPADALDDLDRDGLNNRDEIARGTQLRNPDTDGDTIPDGEEVIAGRDGFITNPLLADTDGDGVPDNIEVASSSNPTNPASVNLAAALSGIRVLPPAFTIIINSVEGQAFQQLSVLGDFRLGGTIDLTARSRGTNYLSSSLTVCNFGAEDGRIFGGSDGTCTITVSNSGFTAAATGSVRGFAPSALGFTAVAGFANAVTVNGNFAYIAAGRAGLLVVNVSNKNAPTVVGSYDTPGNANGVDVAGNFAYVADGAAGLQIINISNPTAPALAAAIVTSGEAKDVVVRAGRAYVANGDAGLRIVDVSVAGSPTLLGAVNTPGQGKGVAVDLEKNRAVIADGTAGIVVINVSNPASPQILGSVSQGLADARDVALRGDTAIVADHSVSMTAVDLTNPAAPVVRNSTPSSTGGLLNDVVLSNTLALGADVVFVNGVPIVDVSNPNALAPRSILNFAGDFDGQGVAADANFVYLVAVSGSAFEENGIDGFSRLSIGQFRAQEDRAGIPPVVTITAPANGSSIVEGRAITAAVTATDDIEVARVDILVNGQLAASDTSAPYEFSIPTTAQGTVSLRARAVDLGDNIGLSGTITVTVIPDPLTTVTGRVIDRNSAAVAGATVTVLGRTTATGSDGRFTLAGVPTAPGNIIVSASAVIGGRTLRGRSAPTPPVLAGVTNTGDIRLSGGRVGLLHCDSPTAIRNALVASGQIDDADIVELPACTVPALSTLSDLGAVLAWTNSSFSNPDGIGNVLADYVDQGGGVVMATYGFSQTWRISGRIQTTGYSPFLIGTPNTPANRLSLANSNTAHPIMAGVPDGPYFINFNYSTVPLAGGAQLIASDVNGNRVVAVNQSNRVVGISIFPGFGDMGRLFANAINFVR